MNLNPFENIKNEYNLEDILKKNYSWGNFEIKSEYSDVFNSFNYELLIKSINTKIDWHILTSGGYQGDYWYIAEYNGKIYFLDVGYGSCSMCDNFMASEDDIKNLKELQSSLKSQIREYNSWEEFLSWIADCNEWWLSDKDAIIEFAKHEFDVEDKLKYIEYNNKIKDLEQQLAEKDKEIKELKKEKELDNIFWKQECDSLQEALKNSHKELHKQICDEIEKELMKLELNIDNNPSFISNEYKLELKRKSVYKNIFKILDKVERGE